MIYGDESQHERSVDPDPDIFAAFVELIRLRSNVAGQTAVNVPASVKPRRISPENLVDDVNRSAFITLLFLPSAALVAFATSAASLSVSLSVSVTDQAGKPVADMVIAAVPTRPIAVKRADAVVTAAVMDQRDLQFVPHVLVVRAGTPVVFPNSDAIAHQVYSFSPARRFELGLYRGRQHEPVLFDHAGVVVLGCNIHDNMVGYIYVTESPWFGMTDKNGEWRAPAMPAGEYRVQIWSPRLARQEGDLEQKVLLDDAHAGAVAFHLVQPLRPAPVSKPHDRRLRDY